MSASREKDNCRERGKGAIHSSCSENQVLREIKHEEEGERKKMIGSGIN